MGAFLVVAIYAQDIESIIERLKSDDIEVREAATADIVKLGKDAISTLKPYERHADPEVSARVFRAIGEIERLVRIEVIRPTWRKLTLKIEGERAADAVAKVFGPFGIEASMDAKAADTKVSLDLTEAGLWQAFEAFCEASESRPLNGQGIGQEFRAWVFHRGMKPFDWIKTVDAGVARIELESTVYGKRTAQAGDMKFTMRAILPPGHLPLRSAVSDLRVTDEAGTVVDLQPTTSHRWQTGVSHARDRVTTVLPWEGSAGAAALKGAKALRFEGKLILTYPADVERTDLDLRGGGAVADEIGDVRFEVSSSSYEATAKTWKHSLSIRGATPEPPADVRTFHTWIEDKEGAWIADGCRYEIGKVTGRGSGSEYSRLNWRGQSIGSSSGGHPVAPDKFVVLWLKGEERVEIPFVIDGMAVRTPNQ